MADQTQRLEIATVRAEVGSNIVYRFANDAVGAEQIPTQSGPIQNLKQVVLEIQAEAADKISIATTIYPTVSAGLAATPDQSIFLVQSNDADEIYTVWKNESGTAVNTGKTALSATAIQTALDASNEAAQAAEDAAEVAITRTARYLAPSATQPAARDDGLPLQVGDIWFSTIDQTEYRYTDDGWRPNDSQQSIADIADETDPEKGASLVGFDGAQLDALLLNAKSLPDYAALEAYTGRATGIVITNPGIFGHFYRDPSVTVGDRGTKFIDALGRGWRRRFSGNVNTAWFGSRGDYLISGVFDDVAFSNAAKAAPAVNNISGPAGTTAMPRAPICFIDVPDGSYGFQSTIDVGNKEVTWVFSSAARIQGDTQKKLNGNIVRQGERITKQAYGTHGYATGFSVAVDAEEFDKSPAVTGITSASAFNNIPSHDSVGLFVGNYSKPALHRTTAPCAFTAKTVKLPVPLSAEQLLKIRRGMTVDTLHSPRWVGLLDSWSDDGLTMTVTGWYLYGGSGESTPPNTAGVGIGGNDRAWALNSVLRMNANGYAYQGIGHELSVYNFLGDSGQNLDIDQGRIWGTLTATGGGDSFFCQAGDIVKGNWLYGYVAHTDPKVGFFARSNPDAGFKYHGGNVGLLIEDNANAPQLRAYSTGQIVIGNDNNIVNIGKVIDWKTSGEGLSYDFRLLVRNGGGSAGQAEVELLNARTKFSGHVEPTGNGTKNLGSTTNQWGSVAAVSARFSGPVRCGQYTLATMPSPASWSGHEIDVTDASGGPKRCRSNGTSWVIINTSTVVS